MAVKNQELYKNFQSSQQSSVINLEKGKIPPQAVDLEEVVLGAMMIDKKGVDEVIDILSVDSFYKDSHKFIFEAILQLFESSQPIDLLTVSEKLRKFIILKVIMTFILKIFLTIFFHRKTLFFQEPWCRLSL